MGRQQHEFPVRGGVVVIPEDWCALHCRREPIRWRLPGHRVCGECWHFYRSGAHLRWAELRCARRIYGRGERRYLLRALWKPIYSCPLCAHDF